MKKNLDLTTHTSNIVDTLEIFGANFEMITFNKYNIIGQNDKFTLIENMPFGTNTKDVYNFKIEELTKHINKEKLKEYRKIKPDYLGDGYTHFIEKPEINKIRIITLKNDFEVAINKNNILNSNYNYDKYELNKSFERVNKYYLDFTCIKNILKDNIKYINKNKLNTIKFIIEDNKIKLANNDFVFAEADIKFHYQDNYEKIKNIKFNLDKNIIDIIIKNKILHDNTMEIYENKEDVMIRIERNRKKCFVSEQTIIIKKDF